jgi:hypothetical protein
MISKFLDDEGFESLHILHFGISKINSELIKSINNFGMNACHSRKWKIQKVFKNFQVIKPRKSQKISAFSTQGSLQGCVGEVCFRQLSGKS